MKNKYRNPWASLTNVKRPEFYENNARQVFEYRGVVVFKLHDTSFDYVFAGACITQRAGCDRGESARQVIDGILDGKLAVCDEVAKHVAANGGTPMSWSDEAAMRVG